MASVRASKPVRILHVADLHLEHDWFDWVASHCVDYDLLVVAGDLQNAFGGQSMHDQSHAVSEWLTFLKAPTLVCTGNHDWWPKERDLSVDVLAEGGWLRNLRGKGRIAAVDGDNVSIGGLRIAVNGWQQEPKDIGADIVVSHAPPAGCRCAGDGLRDIGDPYLWPALAGCPPILILSGHIHEARRRSCPWPGVNPLTVVLVAGLDDQSAAPAHWIADTNLGTATHSNGETVALPTRRYAGGDGPLGSQA